MGETEFFAFFIVDRVGCRKCDCFFRVEGIKP